MTGSSHPPINTGLRGNRNSPRRIEFYDPEVIDVGKRLRDLDEASVERLKGSMAEIGLRTPISVRYLAERPADLPHDEYGSVDAMLLLTGAHRLEAAKRLGWEKIECIVYYEGDQIDAQLWEIAENLHRAELTKAQRDEHIRRYAELMQQRQEVSGQIVPKPQGGRPQGIASKIAAETGLSSKTVLRALDPERAAAERERRQAAKAAADVEQLHNDQQRATVLAELPLHIQEHQARRAEAMAGSSGAAPEEAAIRAELDELREALAAAERDQTKLKEAMAKLEPMRVVYEQGGFDAVIAGKDEEIRVLRSRVYTESEDKGRWMRAANYWKAEAQKLGWADKDIIPLDDADDFVPFDAEAPH